MAQSINNLTIGSKIKFGSMYSNPIVWLVAAKNHTGYPSNSLTLVSEKIIKIMAFDAKEPSNSDSDRKSYGNNRYLHSNLRQWLNSDKAGGAWYTAQHSADAPPVSGEVSYNPYNSLPGFLNAFTADEKNAILNTTLTVARNTVTDGGGSETVVDGVFLLSNTEVGLANENSVAEGSLLALFSTSSNRITQPTAAAVSNSDYTNASLSASQAWYWWLRTPYASNARNVRNVHTGGALYNNGAYNGNGGLRPALNLPSDLLISDTTDSDGCYTVILSQDSGFQAWVGGPDRTPIRIPNIIIPGYRIIAGWVGGPDGKPIKIAGDTGPKYDPILANNTWAQIGQAIANDEVPATWTVESEKDILLSTGEVLTAHIWGENHDDLTAGGKARFTVGLKHLMAATRRVNATNTNVGGFTGSELYRWLNGDLLNLLPPDLQAIIKPVDKKTSAGNQSATINTNSMKIFLPSEVEVFGATTYSAAGEGLQYLIFADNTSRIKKLENGVGAADFWWERSPNANGTTAFCTVGNNGSAFGDTASISRGICFAFCI